MITPMIKYSFLIYHKDYIPFLEHLQELGVLHIIEKKKEIDDNIKSSLHQISEINKTLKFLEKRDQEEQEVKGKQEEVPVVENVKDLTIELSEIEQDQSSLNKDIQKAEPWGDFTPDMKDKMAELNITLRFFECSEKNFNEQWNEDYYLQIINREHGKVYFVVFQQSDQEITIDAEEIKLPEEPLSQLLKKREENKKRVEEIQATFDEYAAKYQHQLREKRHKLQSKTDFELAINHTEKQAEEKVMLLEGWVPEDKKPDLEKFLDKQDVYYISSKPSEEDKVPIKLKNNKFSRLFEPISDLFDMPDYKELDLTPFFAPFFMMFFGFCLGDTGYGLLILIGTLIFRQKVKISLKPMFTLAAILGGATVIMGLISGTFFGIELINVQAYPLKDIILKPLQLFWFSVAVGGLQIFYGMFIKAANQIRQGGSLKYGLSTMGWILLVLTFGTFIALEKMGLIPKVMESLKISD